MICSTTTVTGRSRLLGNGWQTNKVVSSSRKTLFKPERIQLPSPYWASGLLECFEMHLKNPSTQRLKGQQSRVVQSVLAQQVTHKLRSPSREQHGLL